MKKRQPMIEEKGVVMSNNEALHKWIVRTDSGFQGSFEAHKFKGGNPASEQRVTVRRMSMNIVAVFLGEAPAATEENPPHVQRDKNKEQQRGEAPRQAQIQQRDQSMPAQRGYRFLNPYNFARFLPLGQSLDDNLDTGLLGRCAPPPHDRYLGLSGKITCALETVTPLFISDSENVDGIDSENKHKTYQFFKIDGHEAIPATALRGMVRNVFETITNSCLSVFDGACLFHRMDSETSPKLVPALVERDGKDWKLKLLTGKRVYNPAGLTRHDEQYAAWVYRYWPMKPSGTLAGPEPTAADERFRAVRREGQPVKIGALEHLSECFALIRKAAHPFLTGTWDVAELSPTRQPLDGKKMVNELVVKGWLFLTNQNTERKHSERFFFWHEPSRPFAFLPQEVALPDEVRENYESLIKDSQRRHRKDLAEHEKHQPAGEPWEDEPGFSRFVKDEKAATLKKGDLVYAMLEESAGKRQVKFIVPVAVSRVAYEKSVGQVLTAHADHLSPCAKYEELCPACRLFGWVSQNAKNVADANIAVAYAGRVTFAHGKLQEPAPKIRESIPLAILAAPKPTTEPFYLLGADGEPSGKLDYGQEGVRLRGRKFYRHHKTVRPEEYRRVEGQTDRQNRTIVEPLDKGAKFEFEVRFENLAPVELGALLWALSLEGGCHHRLGLAKPLGFGSVKVTVANVSVFNPAVRYQSLTQDGWQDATPQQIKSFRKQFRAALIARFGEDEVSRLKADIQALIGPGQPDLPVHYPRPTPQPQAKGKQYEWFMSNKKRPQKLPVASDDTKGFQT